MLHASFSELQAVEAKAMHWKRCSFNSHAEDQNTSHRIWKQIFVQAADEIEITYFLVHEIYQDKLQNKQMYLHIFQLSLSWCLCERDLNNI